MEDKKIRDENLPQERPFTKQQFDMERNMDLHKCQAENRRLVEAIREKNNTLKVCQDRRWEAEEKVGELMMEVDRLNAVIKNVR